MQRRMAFRNERFIYRGQDSNSGEEIFSAFSAEAPVKVYERDFWWSDGWDPMEYGREIDFNRPFLEQLFELSREVPWPSRSVLRLVNSDYANTAGDLKNCYLCFDGAGNEDSMYCITSGKMKHCIDCYQSGRSELCYENFSIAECYKSFFGNNNSGSRNIWFSKSCTDCSDCLGCINLKHKKYHIFNQPYSREEYEKKLKEFNLGSYSSLLKVKAQAEEFFLRNPEKSMTGAQNLNATGEYVWNSKNIKHSYQLVDGENISYSQNVVSGTKDCMDYYSWGDNAELIYESVVCGENIRNLKFCYECWPACQDLEYCMLTRSSANCFGCVGVTKKQYCILNKQYSKEEYEELIPKIKAHMANMPYVDKQNRTYSYGEFFPVDFSAWAYNETAVNDYIPLSKEDAIKQGFRWRDEDRKEFKIDIQSEDLPDHINDVEVSILKQTIGCLSCKKAFRVLPAELEFYQQSTIPLPRLCVECRYLERIKNRNPLKWYTRKCQCAGEKSDNGLYQNQGNTHQSHKPSQHCPNQFETTYPPDSEKIVYCEDCYQQEAV